MFTCTASYSLSFWRWRFQMLSAVSPEKPPIFLIRTLSSMILFPVVMDALENAVARLRQNDPTLVVL